MRLIPEHIQAEALRLASTQTEQFSAYIYDLNALKNHAESLKQSLPAGVECYYAIKANSEKEILKTLAPIVDGFEAASGGELALINESVPQSKILFGGPGKLNSELRHALNCRTEAIHVESITELKRISVLSNELQQNVNIFLRINAPFQNLKETTLTMGGKPTPFGIDLNDLEPCLNVISRNKSLCLKGFHFHLMSHQLSAETHASLIREYFILVSKWVSDYQLKIETINVGGGIGINYTSPENQFNWEAFTARLHHLLSTENPHGFKLRFEFGRYISAFCGYYVMQVIDIKEMMGKQFVISRGGTHQFRTPRAQNHNHPFSIIPMGSSQNLQKKKVTLVGQLCTPKDFLAKDVFVESVSVNDLIVFPFAGAYAWNISHQQFLNHPHPLFVFTG